MALQSLDLLHIKKILTKTALEVGQIIVEKNGTLLFNDKKNSVDLVTELDKKVEEIIKLRLTTEFPDFKFIGEETFRPGIDKISPDPTFIIDPIDGTSNFIHGFPFSCTSLALVYQNEPVVGVVYNPHINQLFSAAKGHGAFLNDKPLGDFSNKPLSLQSSLIALEGGSDREGNNFDVKFATFKQLLYQKGGFIHGFRSFGSAALNLCYVAMGCLDSYWMWCQFYDCAASWIIAKENGVVIVDGNKGNYGPVSIENKSFLCVRNCPKEDQDKYIVEFWGNVMGVLEK
ncbi:hypothetical protein B5S30_g5231 [[Candida] boidinii]|nr:hypothetical protein B5S30_g5231 [[Candida] boidinii]